MLGVPKSVGEVSLGVTWACPGTLGFKVVDKVAS
jgi:hypothetical protein